MISAKMVLKPLPVMDIEQILRELFHDPEKPLGLLRRHQLERLFENSIDLVKREIEQHNIDFGKVRDIATNILVTVNTRLREIPDKNERGYLEQITKEVAQYLLTKLLSSSSSSAKLLSEITSALQTSAKLHGYNFEALVALLKISKKSLSIKWPQRNGFYYQWNCSDNDLDELLANIKSAGWIESTKSFKKLFTDHKTQHLNIQFAKENKVELLALFDVLKDQGLISPKGGKGHFHPLTIHLVDLENKFLFLRDPKTDKNVAKRNGQNWSRMITNGQLWVKGFKTRPTSRLPWPK